eukprot:TRINITY_DN8412_c0_g2_i1.p1 TRINITY_DN8412_c0_g2~~TRINITY_DN8412_c0_g2_i1.p1  ORF type:complete len:478 (+),score=94.26 TRINITY_DN8412_c0_g2_i1:1084-2517(+)
MLHPHTTHPHTPYLSEAVHTPAHLQSDSLTVCIVSSGGSRRILTDPFITGEEYISSLESAAAVFFRSPHWHRLLFECPRRVRLCGPFPTDSPPVRSPSQVKRPDLAQDPTPTKASDLSTSSEPISLSSSLLATSSSAPSTSDTLDPQSQTSPSVAVNSRRQSLKMPKNAAVATSALPHPSVVSPFKAEDVDNRAKIAKMSRVIDVSDRNINVVSILRGSLAFQLQPALAKTGFHRTRASFMSAQRNQVAAGIFQVEDAAYVKLSLSKFYPSIIVMGDIVASGTTLRYVLRTIARECKEHRYRVSHIVLFTIGCPAAMNILLNEANPLMADACEDFVRSVCVFYEGIFTLATNETKVQIKNPGTDFLLLNSTFADEFTYYLKNRQDSIFPFLQQCIVYDGGKRAFSPSEHYEEVLHYFEQVQTLIKSGQTTPMEYLRERWEMIDEFLSPDMKKIVGDTQIFLQMLEHYIQRLHHEVDI